MSHKPNVLIFGGLNADTPSLVQFLVPPAPAESLVGHVRIVDKYSVKPPTTYVGKPFLKLLEERRSITDYRQANLTVPATVAKCFSDPAPNGAPYSVVIDLTGELTFDRPAEVQVAQTLKVALSIANEAVKNQVKSYIRVLPSFYEHEGEKKKHKEDDDNGWKPLGVRGVWWHEMIRAIGNVPGLPLVVLRKAYVYGPNVSRGEVMTIILLGLVYKHLNEEMKFLWSPKLRRNTVHSDDVSAAIWACSEWIYSIDREQANRLAGVRVPPSGDKEVKAVPEAVQKDAGAVLIPVFNISDESDSTQASLGEVISHVFGVTSGFHGSIQSQLAKLKFSDVVEDINELHMGEWTKIIMESTPPVPNTPLTPYAHPYQLEKHGCALDNEKIKTVVGYKLKRPQFNDETVKSTIESFRAEGTWPETDKYPPRA